MIDYLQKFDSRLYERYLTVERNIKAGSNSFYDSYLDLQEQFLRFIITEAGLDSTTRETCGALLKRPDVRELCLSTIGIEQAVFNKLEDYTLKVNAHKHKGEKKVQLETIINYMRIFYGVLIAYATYCCMETIAFNPDYFTGIFGIYEKENAALKAEAQKLKEDLCASIEAQKLKESDIAMYQGLLSAAEIEKMDFESQNAELQRQISTLKDIKLSSMEEKLNKTIDLLNELTASVVENRAISYAVGDTICGRDTFQRYVEKAKKEIKHG